MSDATRPVRLIPFGPKYRASGVLLHITSLPSPYGIGDVGPAAFAMVDRLQAAGQSWWQALPLGPTGYGNSPYQSDLLNLGEEARMNLPGSTEGNWRWRCTDEMLPEVIFERLHRLTTATDRRS
jgi:4-alpha-glucanotransferase